MKIYKFRRLYFCLKDKEFIMGTNNTRGYKHLGGYYAEDLSELLNKFYFHRKDNPYFCREIRILEDKPELLL